MRGIFVLVRVGIVSKSKIFVVFKKEFFSTYYISCALLMSCLYKHMLRYKDIMTKRYINSGNKNNTACIEAPAVNPKQ